MRISNKGRNQGWGAGTGAPEPHDLAWAGAGAGAILFFLEEPERKPEHLKQLEWSRSLCVGAGINYSSAAPGSSSF